MRHREALARVWLAPCSLVGRDGVDDFAEFLRKYIAYRDNAPARAAVRAAAGGGGAPPPPVVGSPEWARTCFVRADVSVTAAAAATGLPRAALEELRCALDAYADFRLRAGFTSLRSLWEARGALPIASFRDRIVATVRESPVTIVAGDTGCGKSTQVPQFLMDAGFGRIVCTQPRRISAMSLCRRCER